MKKNKVFISYKSEDVLVAEQFHMELSNHNISNWFDKDNLYKEVSKEYIELIHNAIENSEIFLLLYSEKVNSSKFIIEHELKHAISNNIPVFCFALDNSPMCSEIQALIQNKQWMYSFRDTNNIASLKDSLKDENRRHFLQSLIDDKIEVRDGERNYSDINLFLMRIAIQRWLNINTVFGTYCQLEQSDTVYGADELIMSVAPYRFVWPVPEPQRTKLAKLGFFSKRQQPDDTDSIVEKFDNTKIENQLKSFISTNYSTITDVDVFLHQVAVETANNFIQEIEQYGVRFNGAMLGVYDVRINRIPNVERHLLNIEMYASDYFTFKFTVMVYHRLRTIDNKFEIRRITQIKDYAPFLCSLAIGGYVVVNQNQDKYLMWTKRSDTIASGETWHFSFDETVNLRKDVIRNSDGKVKLFDGKMRIDTHHNFYRGLEEENGLTAADIIEGGIFELGIIMSDRLEIELLSYANVQVGDGRDIETQMLKYTENASDGKLEISDVKYVSLDDCEREFVGKLVTPEAYSLSQRLQSRLAKSQKRLIDSTVVLE